MISQKNIDYAKSLLAQNKTKEDIYVEFLNFGLSIDSINEIFSAIERENLKKDDKEVVQKKVIRIVVVIGSLLVGAGLFSFIASNWDGIPDALKVMVIVGSMLVSYLAGWYFKQVQANSKTSEALFLLGAIIYGGGLFLVAQIFNISANWPDGFIIWMIGVIAMAFALDSFYLFYFSIPISIAIIGGHASNIFGGSYDGLVSSLSKSLLLVILAVAVTFTTGWMIRRRLPENLKEVF